jgi:hypothetical protein
VFISINNTLDIALRQVLNLWIKEFSPAPNEEDVLDPLALAEESGAPFHTASRSVLARVWTRLNVPPARGHCAKLVVGRAPERQPLPEVTSLDVMANRRKRRAKLG